MIKTTYNKNGYKFKYYPIKLSVLNDAWQNYFFLSKLANEDVL